MIQWKNVSFSYAGQREGGLRRVDLTVKRGECVLFCGRSGCGKTTMLRLVNGLIPGFFSGEGEGEVKLEGREVSDLPMYALAERAGSVFQNPRTQFFNVDTDSEIAFGIENAALPREELRKRVEQTARDFRIEDLRGRSIFALSGGEKQKVAFASVYAMDPQVYVLDEPSSNLDLAAIDGLREHLRLIKSQGKTILIAEHRLYYLMGLADKIVYLDGGEIKGVCGPEAFAQIPQAQRIAMGLRAADLRQIHPQRELQKRELQERELQSGPDQASERGTQDRPEKKPGRDLQSEPRRQAEAVLSLEEVTIRYKKKVILERVSLKAARGEIIAVLGHNGAGKTTFARALCGLHRDCDGRFFWAGKDFDRKARRGQSYMVMQDVGYELFAESVEKECVFGLKNPDLELAAKTLEDLGLSGFSQQHPNTLSGGQKQRLAVAVSMVCGKEILVFDEPTSGLDYDGMAQVAALMEALAAQGKVLFVVTHDYELICRACTRAVCFSGGRLAGDMAVTAGSEEKLREMLGFAATL